MRFLATADLHIQKKEDCALLARILQKAQQLCCDALLIGGDLLDSPFPGAETEAAIHALLGAAPCPVFIAAGNHDPLAVTALYRNLPAGVHCMPETMGVFTLGEKVRLYGYSALREQNANHPLAGFTAPAGALNILLAHGQADGGKDAFQPISAEELASSNLQLAVVGHIHKGEQRQIGGCRLLVPGIPQGRGWDELGEKFVYLIQADPQGGIGVEPCSVAERSFWEYTVDVTNCKNSGEMLAAMQGVSVADHVEARLILVGTPTEGPAAAIAAYTELTGREVKDRTDSSLSVELLREQNTLQGAFVRRALAEIENAPPQEREMLEEALRLGLQALQEAKR